MGNEESSIEQSNKLKQTQSNTWASALDHLPRADRAGKRFESVTKDGWPKKISITRKCGTAKTFVTNTNKDAYERITKSMSSEDSYIDKLIESSDEDSSSVIVIERLAKNCKLIAPSNLLNVDIAEAEAVNGTKRRDSGEWTTGISVSEYSRSYPRRSQTSSEPVFSDTIDEIKKNCIPDDRCFFGNTAGFPIYPSFLNSFESGRISIGTLSDFSGSSTPINFSLQRSDAHHVSDAVTVSLPHTASSEDCKKQLSCLSRVTPMVNERGLTQLHKQNGKRIDFTSSLFSGSKKQYSTIVNQKLPMQVTAKAKVPSAINVIKAD